VLDAFRLQSSAALLLAVGILIGTLTMELGGVVTIKCEKTGYWAELEFKLKVGATFKWIIVRSLYSNYISSVCFLFQWHLFLKTVKYCNLIVYCYSRSWVVAKQAIASRERFDSVMRHWLQWVVTGTKKSSSRINVLRYHWYSDITSWWYVSRTL